MQADESLVQETRAIQLTNHSRTLKAATSLYFILFNVQFNDYPVNDYISMVRKKTHLNSTFPQLCHVMFSLSVQYQNDCNDEIIYPSEPAETLVKLFQLHMEKGNKS